MKVLTSGQGYQQGPQGIDPYKTFDKNLNELKESFKRREANLKGYRLPQEAHNKAVAQIQQEYDDARLKFTTTRLQLDDIKQGMASGQIDPMAGQQAMMELVAPQGTVEAMFPKPERQPATRPGGLSPGQAKTLKESFSERIGATIINPPGWGKDQRKQVDPGLLKEQYFIARAESGYDSNSKADKVAFDLSWDSAIGANPKALKVWKQLKDNDPDIFMSRTYDARLLNIAARKAQGQPISPMAKSLQEQKPKIPLGTKIALGAVSLSPLGGHMARRWMTSKRKTLENRLPTVSTDEDYDKLQSGQQFTDPQGNVRTKP